MEYFVGDVIVKVYIISKYGEPRAISLYRKDAEMWLEDVGGGYLVEEKFLVNFL